MPEGTVQNTTWPLPKFFFSVTFDNGVAASFQEVTGLETETRAIEYRAGDNKNFSPIKMPGLARVGNVTLRKGIFAGETKFWDWYKQIKLNTILRATVTISLLDEGSNPKYTWRLDNAFPTKLTGTDLKAEGNEIAVESIELAFETLTISPGGSS